jgi:hypothetical protein
MVDAYNLTADHRDRLYNEAYTQFRDTKSDIIAGANLKLTENSVIGTNLRNAYDISANEYELRYTQEFNEWNRSVENALSIAGMEQNNYQFNQNYDQTERWNDKNFGLKQNEYKVSTGDTDMDGVLSPDEIAKMNTSYSYDDNGNVIKGTKDKSSPLTNTEINSIKSAYKNAGGGQKGYDAVESYLKGIGKTVDNEVVDNYIVSAEAEEGLPVWYQTWTITKDTFNGNNPFVKGNEDYNDKYTNLNGETLTYKELKKKINKSGLSDEEKKALLESLSSQSKK